MTVVKDLEGDRLSLIFSKKSPSPCTHTESLNSAFGFFCTVERVLVRKKTLYQTVEVFETEEFGKTLLLDGILQVVEKNEFLYHELMVHPAMITHVNPRSILVLGGGDGGVNREVLRYEDIRSLTHVDLDREVIEIAKTYLPSVSKGAFENPKVSVIIEDGRRFLRNKRKQYDLIIMDMTDPIGPSKHLYTLEFFRCVRDALRPRGLFSMHTGSPIAQPVLFGRILRTLSKTFRFVSPFYNYIQMYGTLWSTAVASDGYDLKIIQPATIRRRLRERNLPKLNLFTPESFRSMQVEFPYLNALRQKKGTLLRESNIETLL